MNDPRLNPRLRIQGTTAAVSAESSTTDDFAGPLHPAAMPEAPDGQVIWRTSLSLVVERSRMIRSKRLVAPDEGEAKGKDEDEEVTIEEVRELKWGGRWTIAAVVEGHWIVLSATRIGDRRNLGTPHQQPSEDLLGLNSAPAEPWRTNRLRLPLSARDWAPLGFGPLQWLSLPQRQLLARRILHPETSMLYLQETIFESTTGGGVDGGSSIVSVERAA